MAKTKFDNYTGTLQFTAGITQKPGCDFPLVDSHDIMVAETGKRLNQKLDEIDTALSNGSGDGKNTNLLYGDGTIGLKYNFKNGSYYVDKNENCIDLVKIASNIVHIPVTRIGEEAFANCLNLRAVVIPKTITSIGEGAFRDAHNLTSVYYLGNPFEWKNINIEGDNESDKYLFESTLYYYSENKPTSPGYFWHYDENGNVVIWKGVEPVNNFKYELNSDGTAYTVIGVDEITNENLVIPAFYNGVPVTAIGESAFLCMPNFTSVTIQNGITSIGREAFCDCLSLDYIIIPESLTYIGEDAFCGCTRLAHVYYESEDPMNIDIEPGNDCFTGAYYYYYSSNYPIITGNYWYYDISGIPAKWNNNLPSNDEFMYILNADESSYTVIGNGIDTNYLEIPSTFKGLPVIAIGDSAFSHNKNLESVIIPDGITIIGDSAFYDCTSLVGITIPDSVTSIGDFAFYGCSGLTSLTIGNKVTYIGEQAFADCRMFTAIYYIDSPTTWDLITLGNYAIVNEIIYYYSENEPTEEGNYWRYVDGVPEKWEAVTPKNELDYALNATNTAYIVKGIGNCTDRDIVIPSIYNGLQVTTIDSGAFENNSNITSVVIATGVTSIKTGAFYGCTQLERVNIPDSVINISEFAFGECRALEEIHFNAIAMNDLIDENHVFARAGRDGKGIKVVIGDYVTKIPDYLFCPKVSDIDYSPLIVSIEFVPGSSCESIGKNAFYGCDSLSDIIIPDSVARIADSAFSRTGLITFNIPNGLSELSSCMFDGCKNLVHIIIPKSVTIIHAYAFDGCSSISHVYYKGTPQEWASIVIESIGDGNSSIIDATKYYYSESEPTNIGDYWCYDTDGSPKLWGESGGNLEYALNDDGTSYSVVGRGGYVDNDIVIPSTFNGLPVTAIGKKAFSYESYIKSVTIPNSVMSFGKEAFDGCERLKKVYISDMVSWCNSQFESISSNPLYEANADLYLNGNRVIVLEIPSRVTTLKKSVFAGCSFTNVVIPKSVTSIDDYAFMSCEKLERVSISNSVTTVGKYVFAYCEALEFISIPSSLAVVGENMFLYCNSLTDAHLTDGVSSISASAFEYCKNLKYVRIPKSLNYIGDSAFYGCRNIVRVDYGGSNEEYWRAIDIKSNNSNLESAPREYGK